MTRMRDEGMPVKVIARRLGLTPQAVYYSLDPDRKLKRRRRQETKRT